MTVLIVIIVSVCVGWLIGEIGDRHNIPKGWQYVIGGLAGSAIGLTAHIISRT